MDQSEVAVIIPAFNEQETIDQVVKGVLPYGVPLVVSDASTDNTAKYAEQAGAQVVSLTKNRGYDGAIDAGFEKAIALGFKYAITFDADGQHDPKLLEKYKQKLAKGAKLVVGVRPRYQRPAELLFGSVSQYIYGVKDPLCGMKGYHLDLYKELGHFDSYDSIGTELAFYAIKNNCQWDQVQVPMHPRKDGEPRFDTDFRANKRIFMAMVKTLIPRLRKI